MCTLVLFIEEVGDYRYSVLFVDEGGDYVYSLCYL